MNPRSAVFTPSPGQATVRHLRSSSAPSTPTFFEISWLTASHLHFTGYYPSTASFTQDTAQRTPSINDDNLPEIGLHPLWTPRSSLHDGNVSMMNPPLSTTSSSDIDCFSTLCTPGSSTPGQNEGLDTTSARPNTRSLTRRPNSFVDNLDNIRRIWDQPQNASDGNLKNSREVVDWDTHVNNLDKYIEGRWTGVREATLKSSKSCSDLQ